MNKKRRKLYHFEDMVLTDKINFYDCYQVKYKGQNGWIYLLSDKLTDDQREKMKRYDNVIITSCRCQYAPEIMHDSLILLK